MKNNLGVEIIEIFSVKVANVRYNGTIKRQRDENNNHVVIGNVKCNNETVLASAKDQWELEKKIVEIITVVDRPIMSRYLQIGDFRYYTN